MTFTPYPQTSPYPQTTPTTPTPAGYAYGAFGQTAHPATRYSARPAPRRLPLGGTTPFHLQAVLAFGVSLAMVVGGQVLLPVPAWTRAFLALGTLFLVSSCFTLAKAIRDQQERETVVSRIDQARIERMLAEYDPYRVPVLEATEPPPADREATADWTAEQDERLLALPDDRG